MIKTSFSFCISVHISYFRASLEKSGQGNTLVLRLVTGADSGDYTCHVSSANPIFLTHSLTVRGESVCHWGKQVAQSIQAWGGRLKILFISNGTMNHVTSSCKSFMDRTAWRILPRYINPEVRGRNLLVSLCCKSVLQKIVCDFTLNVAKSHLFIHFLPNLSYQRFPGPQTLFIL